MGKFKAGNWAWDFNSPILRFAFCEELCSDVMAVEKASNVGVSLLKQSGSKDKRKTKGGKKGTFYILHTDQLAVAQASQRSQRRSPLSEIKVKDYV